MAALKFKIYYLMGLSVPGSLYQEGCTLLVVEFVVVCTDCKVLTAHLK